MARIQDDQENPILENVSAGTSFIALNDEILLSVFGQGAAAVSIDGTWVGTIEFQGSVDGVRYDPITGIDPADGSSGSAHSVNGLWLIACSGLGFVKVKATAWTSGSAVVAAQVGYGAGTVSLTPYASGGTQYAEDTASAAGDMLTMAGVVRSDAGGTLVGADGDRTQLQVDAAGALRVTGGGGGTEYTVNVPAPADPTGGAPLAERDDVLATLGEADGDWTNLRTNDRGALWVKHDGVVSAASLITDGVDTALVTGAGALVVDGSGVTQPISAASLPLPTGAATSANQLPDGHNVTVDNAGGAAAVNIQDGGNSITVDAASLPLPTGAATAANQLANGHDVTVDNVAGTNPVPVQGNTAHDSVAAGNPLQMGGVASADEPTAVAAGDAVRAWLDLHGRTVIVDGHGNPEPPATVNATASGDTTVIAAPGGGTSLHIKKGSIHNRGGTTRVVALRDGAGGTLRWRAELAPNGGGSTFDFGSHGWALTAATLLAVNLDAVGDIDVNITEYYIAP